MFTVHIVKVIGGQEGAGKIEEAGTLQDDSVYYFCRSFEQGQEISQPVLPEALPGCN